MKDGEESSDDKSMSSELEDNSAFQAWYQQTLDKTRNEKYIDQGMDEEQAKERVHAKNDERFS